MNNQFVVRIGDKYECKVCNDYTAKNKKAIHLHMRYSHDKVSYKNVDSHSCEFCDKTFKAEKEIKRHVKKCMR